MPRNTILRLALASACLISLVGSLALIASAGAPSSYVLATPHIGTPVSGMPQPMAPRGSSTLAPAFPAGANPDHVTEVVYASADTFIGPDVGESRGDLPYIEVGGGRVALLKFDLNGVIPPRRRGR